MIPNDFIQTLLSRVDIVDVVDRYVPLKKAGANYVACCPFHSEKTPSFTVSQSKQFYHCFGCGAHGTAIGFLMEYGGKAFPDAVEELARDAGLEVPRIEMRPGDARRTGRPGRAFLGCRLIGLLGRDRLGPLGGFRHGLSSWLLARSIFGLGKLIQRVKRT